VLSLSFLSFLFLPAHRRRLPFTTPPPPPLCSTANTDLPPQIDVLRRLNYRGANVAQINDDRIVEELLK
jgi:hypothetical protein